MAEKMKIKCIRCGSFDTRVLDMRWRKSEEVTKRKVRCLICFREWEIKTDPKDDDPKKGQTTRVIAEGIPDEVLASVRTKENPPENRVKRKYTRRAKAGNPPEKRAKRAKRAAENQSEAE